MLPASYLYVPGDRPDRFANAVESGADAVIFDLEDSVRRAAKATARAAVAAHLDHAPADRVEQWVRINSGDVGVEDLAAVYGSPGLTGLFVPKATHAALNEVLVVAPVPCCALIETAATLFDLPNVALNEHVVALAMGEVDLTADLGVEPSEDEHEVWPFRMQVVAASSAAGLRAPIGPVFLDINQLEKMREHTTGLRRAGFEARQAVHPSQVAVINAVMAPTNEELDAAQALLALAEAAGGGACVDASGRMVDEAVLRRARRTLDRRPDTTR